jgi:glutathione S-transferase
LEYQNKPLYESTVLCEFIEDAFPDHKPQLLPSDPYEKARTRIWTDFTTSRIIPSFHRFLQFQPMDDKKGLQEVREEFLNNLKQFAEQMDKEGPYFLGAEPCLVDFIVAPWAVRLWIFDTFKDGLNTPEEGNGGKDELTWARWRKWLNAIENRKSIKDTLSDREQYMKLYSRYADNTAQSELAKATRSGRGVP